MGITMNFLRSLVSILKNPKLSKIATIMADALEQEKVYTIVSPEAEHRLARAVETAAKELVKIM